MSVTVTGTWVPVGSLATDPVPSTIVSVATNAGSSGSSGSPLVQAANDGYGDPTGVATSTGTHYFLQTASSFTVPLSLTASVSATSTATAAAVAGVSLGRITITASVPTINPFGATSDGNGNWVIMIGEHFTPELVGIPTALSNNVTYIWTVSGTTLQSWIVSPDSKTTTEVDGPGLLNIALPGWYWNDLQNKGETVTCTATVTPPPGQGSPFTVTASQAVSVYVPIWTGTGTGGYVKVNNYPTSTNSNQYYIFTGPTLNMILDGDTDGMSFNATVASPIPNLISAGSLQLVQLVTPFEIVTSFDGYETKVDTYPGYGENGLDGLYPYGWIRESNPPGPYTYYTGDTPSILLLDQITYAVNLKHDFQDFLMFLAPGSQQPVPVAHFIWSDDGNARIPSTGFWKDYASQHGGSDAAGTDTVTPSGNDATFLPSNVFPMWTQIN